MGRRPLLWSALGFLLLLAVTWWVVRDREKEPAESFFRLRGRSPDTLTVAYGRDTTVVVSRSEREWLIIRPVEYPADPSVVESLISLRTAYGIRSLRLVLSFAWAGRTVLSRSCGRAWRSQNFRRILNDGKNQQEEAMASRR